MYRKIAANTMQLWRIASGLLLTAAATVLAQSPPDPLAQLADTCADVRRQAVRHTTSNVGRPNAATIDRMIELLKSDPFPDIREDAAASLGLVRPLEPLVPALIAALDDPSPDVVGRAAGQLGFYGDDARSAARLIDLSEDSNDRVRPTAQAALAALVRRGIVKDEATTRRLIAVLSRELRDPSFEARSLRMRATEMIAAIPHPDTVPAMIAALQDPTDVRRLAWRATRKSTDRRLVGPLVTVVQSAEAGQPPERLFDQTEAASALGRIKNSGAVNPLRAVLRKPNLDAHLVSAIVTALGDIGSASAEPDIRALLTSPSQDVRDAAAAAVPKLVDATPPLTLPASELRMPSVTELLGPPLNLVPEYGLTLFSYEIPEGYRGFLAIDFQTPGCPPLQQANGRTLVRFGTDGRACTSTGFRTSSLAADSLAFRVGPSGRVAIELKKELWEHAVAPLPLTERLPSRNTWRATMFAGSEAELRAARGCAP